MTSHKGQARNPRAFGPVARAVIKHFKKHKIVGARWKKTKHVMVTFDYLGEAAKLRMACSPRNPGKTIDRTIERLDKILKEIAARDFARLPDDELPHNVIRMPGTVVIQPRPFNINDRDGGKK